ncbi:MAG: hypothetical protein GX549_02465 [Clostridiales bacterium]|nr:hypothetical protein [Clostridiales bacterium]
MLNYKQYINNRKGNDPVEKRILQIIAQMVDEVLDDVRENKITGFG